MATHDSDIPELESIHEGMGTLSAQTTRNEIDRLTTIIRKQIEKGRSGSDILNAMKQQLPDIDEHTRMRLWQLAVDENIGDDFEAENIESIEQPKPNTIKLTLTDFPPQLSFFSLVRYQGKDWVITASQGRTWILKLVE